MRLLLILAALGTTLACAPAQAAATRATGILMTFALPGGGIKPALFSMPSYDMPMAECRKVIRGQTQILRVQLRSDRDYFGLRYVESSCVYLDTDPLGLED